MADSDITQDDIETAYGVLEALRDGDFTTPDEERILNEAHVAIQEWENLGQ